MKRLGIAAAVVVLVIAGVVAGWMVQNMERETSAVMDCMELARHRERMFTLGKAGVKDIEGAADAEAASAALKRLQEALETPCNARPKGMPADHAELDGQIKALKRACTRWNTLAEHAHRLKTTPDAVTEAHKRAHEAASEGLKAEDAYKAWCVGSPRPM